jgi:hypothetical protein
MQDPINGEREESVQRHGDLEIEESMRAQRRIWKVQRVVRGFALLVLALSLAGLLGGGPLSHQSASSGGHAVDYERIGYRDSPQSYRLQLASEVARSGKARIWLDRETLSRMKLGNIVPEPSRSVLATDRILFEFEFEEASGQTEILFDFEPTAIGAHTARLGVESGPTFELPQLFLP